MIALDKNMSLAVFTVPKGNIHCDPETHYGSFRPTKYA